MEEADILSDRLAVICDGKLKCVGTPLYLKNTYGDGYRISLVCDTGNERKIIELMSKIAPSSKLIDESGGSMVFSIPIHLTLEIGQLFSLIEEKHDALDMEAHPDLKELRAMLKDVGISHTTLEEVFMKVTGKKKSKYVTKDKAQSNVHPVK
jgi:ABC-type multidrug transport system ATPase subunit